MRAFLLGASCAVLVVVAGVVLTLRTADTALERAMRNGAL